LTGDPGRTRVVSWNLWKRGGPWQRRHDLIARTLAEVTPDLVTLQQAWATADADQAAELAARLGLPHVVSAPYGVPASTPELEVRLAILSRWPLRDRVTTPLPGHGAGRLGRIVLGAVVEHPSGPLPVVTTHLNSDPAGSADRMGEVTTVAELTAELSRGEQPKLGPVVTGDLNAEPQSDEVRRLGGLLTAPAVPGLALEDAWHYADDDNPGWTWRRENPYLAAGTRSCRIDYILAGQATRILRSELLGAAPTDGMWGSTHAGVLAELVI